MAAMSTPARPWAEMGRRIERSLADEHSASLSPEAEDEMSEAALDEESNMIKKIAFVRHRSNDIDADTKFWGELLGLELAQNHHGKWLEFEGPDGKTIAVEQMSPEGTPPSLALETDDIDAEVARLKAAGVTFQQPDIMDSGVCKMAFVTDPSGNALIIHQMNPDRVSD